MWWKNTDLDKKKGIMCLILLGLFFFSVSTQPASDAKYHFASQETYVEAKAYAGTLDLDWSPINGAEQYEILWSAEGSGYFVTLDTVEGFGYAISPYMAGTYKIVALQKGKRTEIDEVVITK